VGRPHGLDGSFYLARPVPGLLAVGASVTVGGELREVERLDGTAARPIVRVSGCADREAADALRRAPLVVPRAAAPALGPDEWWPDELEGCRVHDGDRVVGVVTALRGLPSCDVLEVAREDGGELLVPLVRDAVREVDVAGRRIEVDLRFLEGEEPPDRR